MVLEVRDNLIGGVLISILLTGGDLTGLPMNGLVSYQEQDASALQALDARIGVIRVGASSWRLVYGWVLAGEPLVPRGWLSSLRILDLVDLTQAVFHPGVIVVHSQVGRSVRLDDHLDAVRWHVVRKVKAVQAVADVGVDGSG